MNPVLEGWTPPARPKTPRQSGADVTKLSLHGEITIEGSVALFAAIEAARCNTIEIEIDSGGGSALAALALYELLILHPRQVATTIVGRCSSGAAIVAMAGDRRCIVASGTVMLHLTTGPNEWRDHVDDLAARIFSDATGQPDHLVDAWHAGEATFNAAEAVTAGLAHEILTTRRPADVPGAGSERRNRPAPLALPFHRRGAHG